MMVTLTTLAAADVHVVKGLEENVDYEVFVQPYAGSILGLPSQLQLVRTHQVSRLSNSWPINLYIGRR